MPACDPELRERLVQVVADGPRADEQPPPMSRLTARCGQPHHLQFLRGQLRSARFGGSCDALPVARSSARVRSALRLRADPLEYAQRTAQRFTGSDRRRTCRNHSPYSSSLRALSIGLLRSSYSRIAAW